MTSTKPAGPSSPATSASLLVPLPQGVNDIDFHREGPNGPVDPTNLLAVTGRYEGAINVLTINKLNEGKATATSTCQSEERSHTSWSTTVPDVTTVSDPLSEEQRCAILLGDAGHLTTRLTGVFWCRQPPPTYGLHCHDMAIQVTPIDPLKPPAADPATLAALAPSTPRAIIWDLNRNGLADGECPASAPVMRSILEYHRHWDPQVIIIDGDGTVHRGDLPFDLGSQDTGGVIPGPKYGLLRPSQVEVCGTSLDPPPSPQLPCVTGGDICPGPPLRGQPLPARRPSDQRIRLRSAARRRPPAVPLAGLRGTARQQP